MIEAIIAASASVIVACITLVGVVSSNRVTKKQMENKFEIAQAVTENKIEELTREVREHNNFARRMPVVEEQIKVINHRIDDVEKKER